MVVLAIEGEARGSVELAVTIPFFSPLAQELAVLAEDGYTLEALIGNVDVFVLIEDD